MKSTILTLALLFIQLNLHSQSFPWERPLKTAWSSDGITFSTPSIFQDSSGVPSLIRWKGDTLICTFQWFPATPGSPSFDRVAVKFSYDAGITWTTPSPIIINGMPANYQRPFDPTLAAIDNDSLRIYFSSSDGMPIGGLDSTVNTYSAVSIDGIHYNFEPNARVDQLNYRVIDPAVIYFNNSWHYTAPIGAPQQGAYHYLSPDGLNFMQAPNIPSDNMHNWTGNFMVDSNELRFYGASPTYIWYNSSVNGGAWNGYINTNLNGGDPSTLKISNGNYLIVYVGEPYSTDINENISNTTVIYPNPVKDYISISGLQRNTEYNYVIYTSDGKEVLHGNLLNNFIDVKELEAGFYILRLIAISESTVVKFLKD